MSILAPLYPALCAAAVLLSYGLSGVVSAADDQPSCAALSEHVMAHYSITSSSARTARPMEFWRSDRQVLYSYPDQEIADKWSLTANGYLKPTRFFVADQRAIEYDAFDINRGKGSRDWQSRVQWISQKQLDSWQKTGSSGEGCTRVETYVSPPANVSGERVSFAGIELAWMPELRLVQRYRLKSTDTLGQRRVTQWQLDDLETGQALVEARLQAFDDYAATDFADIGDNESDPFLMKMIRLGFVEHGAAGFYNADGSPLAGAGHFH